MADEVKVTIRGRLTEDPQLRFIQSGSPVVNLNVAHNSRRFDKNKNEWVDTETTFYPVSLWGGPAENVAETLRKGSPVVVHGVQGTRSWGEGEDKKSRLEVKADYVGLDLTFVKVEPEHVIKSTPKSGGGQQAQPAQQAPKGGSDNDPWQAPAQQGEAPF